ncbi:MAG TPA: hypothetical protein DCP71_09440 [Verrucomicrobiales bacterium]|nr:hypothetical protein [Verrucomicrobiales bacterium]
MPLPESIMNLGAPRHATPEIMAALRAEKARQGQIIVEREKTRLHGLADYIVSNPESRAQAKAYVMRFLNSPDHSALHWALREWRDILEQRSLSEIASLLKDDSESTRHLRETAPFARPQSARLAKG